MSKIVLITGPAGAGKSSVAKSLVKNLPGTWALIIQDDTRAFVKSGFKHADVKWTKETKKQWEVSIDICCDMINRYYKAGINSVVELFAPPEEFKKWQNKLKGIDYEVVVLYPNVETAVQRNANRKLKMKEAKIREQHPWFANWKNHNVKIINTTKHTLKETVDLLKKSI